MRHPIFLPLAGLLLSALTAPVQACDQPLIEPTLLQPAMQRYFGELARTRWEGGHPFGHIDGARIYMSHDFDALAENRKRQLLSLLLLDYGAYRPLLSWLSPETRAQIARSGGAMPAYEVYSADGRLISMPYNGCHRMTFLTEYERARSGFLGVRYKRIQRFPMSAWQQEQIKKLFWDQIGYKRAGDFWIAWVPESGHFEIDVPDERFARVLDAFWLIAPAYYRYVVVARGRRLYTRVGGRIEAP